MLSGFELYPRWVPLTLKLQMLMMAVDNVPVVLLHIL